MKTKFDDLKTTKNRHFLRILNDRPKRQKYASFEGVKKGQNAWFYRHLSLKKALLRNAHFRIFWLEKRDFLVQNIKNQLLHQLPRRGIWVIQTFTFGINFPYLGNNLHHFHSCVISHANHIVFCGPWRSQFQPFCHPFLALFFGSIVGNHQILEEIK